MIAEYVCDYDLVVKCHFACSDSNVPWLSVTSEIKTNNSVSQAVLASFVKALRLIWRLSLRLRLGLSSRQTENLKQIITIKCTKTVIFQLLRPLDISKLAKREFIQGSVIKWIYFLAEAFTSATIWLEIVTKQLWWALLNNISKLIAIKKGFSAHYYFNKGWG